MEEVLLAVALNIILSLINALIPVLLTTRISCCRSIQRRHFPGTPDFRRTPVKPGQYRRRSQYQPSTGVEETNPTDVQPLRLDVAIVLEIEEDGYVIPNN